MKLFWKDVLAGLIMGLVVPGILLNFAALLLDKSEKMDAVIAEQTVAVQQMTELTDQNQQKIKFRKPDGTVEQRILDDYLVGVLLAEMPAWFEPEALKAQAVVARTYSLKAFCTGGKHGDGSVCTKPECCQAYIFEEEYIDKGGTNEDLDKVRDAVMKTSGKVLVYDGELIEATYFSCSGGLTEDAAAVWGTDFPYLRSVSSPGEERAKYHTDAVFFTPEEFCRLLDISPQGKPADWIGSAEYTSGGGIAQIVIGGEMFSGVELRNQLGLRSTAISLSVQNGGITVTTRGFGHRVGMSQYGADAMAVSGKDYPEILAHYYQGAILTSWDETQ